MTKQEFIEFIDSNIHDMIELNFDDMEFNEKLDDLDQRLEKLANYDTLIYHQFKEQNVCLTKIWVDDKIKCIYTNFYNIDYKDDLIEIGLAL